MLVCYLGIASYARSVHGWYYTKIHANISWKSEIVYHIAPNVEHKENEASLSHGTLFVPILSLVVFLSIVSHIASKILVYLNPGLWKVVKYIKWE